MFLAGVSGLFAAESWSATETWPNGLPSAGDIVTIPAQSDILLDIDPPELGGLIIKGNLRFEEKSLHLSSRWILIDGGTLAIGSPSSPHTSEARITLTGTDETENIPAGHDTMGTKFVGVMNNGSLELHGERGQTLNWTQLAANALAGSTQLRLANAVEWRPGDRIVIAPSGFDPTEAEEVTVTSVTDSLVNITPALQHDHWGELQTIGGHVIDERAEVACLTRNIIIQGDAASEQSEFGGHLMFGPNASIHIEGVELYRMGQKGHAARYPIHWHWAGDRQGDYASGNSIHHSYHRAIVTHRTSNVLVENNVAYDVWSHTFVPSEDGMETGNRFIGNLGILTRRLALADYTFPESAGGASFQSEGRPGVFWMRNPDNILIGNHAAGVVNGMGFFFDGPGIDEEWSGIFTDNVAHSCAGPSGTVADRYPGLTVGYGLFMEKQKTPSEIRFLDLTAYKNTLSGIWLEAPGQIAQNAKLADNGTGAILFQASLQDSVIIGQSQNTIGPLPTVGVGLSGGIHLPSSPVLKAPILRNIDFIDQRDAGIVLLDPKLHPQSILENLRFTNTPPCKIVDFDQLTGGFTDSDGSFRGDGIPVYIHGNDELVESQTTAFDSDINAFVTPLSGLQFLSMTYEGRSNPDVGYVALANGSDIEELLENGLDSPSSVRSGYVRSNTNYQLLRFGPLPDGVRFSVTGPNSDFVSLEMSLAASAFAYETAEGEIPDLEKEIAPATSLADYASNPELVWFPDYNNGVLYARLSSDKPMFLFDEAYAGFALDIPERMWLYQKFGYKVLAQESEPAFWGEFADPDGDGLKNRLEYLMGTNPLAAESPMIFSPSLGRLSFPINLAATDIEFAVLYSNDLVNWFSDTLVQNESQPDGSNLVNMTVPNFELNNSLFMKLQADRSTSAVLNTSAINNAITF